LEVLGTDQVLVTQAGSDQLFVFDFSSVTGTHLPGLPPSSPVVPEVAVLNGESLVVLVTFVAGGLPEETTVTPAVPEGEAFDGPDSTAGVGGVADMETDEQELDPAITAPSGPDATDALQKLKLPSPTEDDAKSDTTPTPIHSPIPEGPPDQENSPIQQGELAPKSDPLAPVLDHDKPVIAVPAPSREQGSEPKPASPKQPSTPSTETLAPRVSSTQPVSQMDPIASPPSADRKQPTHSGSEAQADKPEISASPIIPLGLEWAALGWTAPLRMMAEQLLAVLLRTLGLG
jgi:hypothetical protein